MSSLLRWCLGHRSVVVFAAVLVVAGGAFGATQLNQQFFPDADFPFLAVTVQAPGLSAEQVDEQVAVPVEQAARGLEDIENTKTRSSEGRVSLITQFAYGTDTDTARDDLSTALDEVTLPEGAGDFDIQGGFTDQAIMNVALSTDGDPSKLTDRAEDLQDEIEQVPGVARVDLEGGTQEQYDVALKEKAIEAGQTPAALAQQIQGALGGQPVGAVQTPRANTPLQVRSDEIDSVKELKDFPIDEDRELSDIATVRERPDPGTGLARTNGKPSVSLSVLGEDTANQVETIDKTGEVLDGVRGELGPGNVTTILETASQVRASIRGLLIEGLLGALFAVVVIFIFLRSWRPTLIAAISIPTSIVFGLLAAWALGLTLNIISLAGLTIAIGRVIDDAIVVLENIYKHLERGEPRFEAAYRGTREVVTAIGSSTLATAAVFIPLGVVGGLISEIFLSFSIIVVAALLASLLVALTVIPVFATFLLKPKTGAEKEGFLSRAVTPVTRGGLRFRWLVIGAALLLFLATVGLVGRGAVPIQFLPDSGTQQVTAEIELPPGVSTERADRLLRPLEREVSRIDGISDSQVSFGGAQLTFDPEGAGQGAQLFATFEEGANVEEAVLNLRRFGEREFPDGFQVQRLANGPPSGVFEATIRGDSVAEVERGAARVEALVKRRSDTVEVSNDAAREEPEYVLEVDDDMAGTAEARQATQALSSLVPPARAGLTEDDTPIEVRLPNDLLKDADALEDLPVPAAGAAGGAGAGGGDAAAGAGAPQATASGAPQSGASAGGGVAAGGAPSGAPAGGGAPGGGGTDAGGAASAGAAGAGGAVGGGPAQAAAVQSAPEPTKVGDVGDVERRQQPGVRSRVNGEIATTVSAKLLGEDTNATITEIQEQVSKADLGGSDVLYGGDADFINQMFTDLLLAMGTAIVLVFLVLVVFFGSVGQPITILAPILFSTIGSLGALVITRQALGLPAMIGQLLLIGIVVANSILLVDTALRLRRGGMARNDALVESARLRVRPVLMTAVATIAALLPLAVGVSGEGGIISQSLGTVVIGGLLTATLLTLVIVPAVFTVFDRGRRGGPPAELGSEARPGPAANGREQRTPYEAVSGGGGGRRVGETGAPAEA